MTQMQIEDACYYGRFGELKTLCRMASEDTKFFYLEDFCNPHLSKYHLMCANYIISGERTAFLDDRYLREYVATRNWALRDYLMAFRITRGFTKWMNVQKQKKIDEHKKNIRVASILKFGY